MTAGAGIVVTGFEAITPAGMGAARLWEACVAPRPCGDVVTRFDVSRHASRIAAAVEDFSPEQSGLSPGDVARMDRATQLAVVAARGALANAGLETGRVDPRRVGTCIGTAIGGVGFMERVFAEVAVPGRDKPRFVPVRPPIHPHVYEAYLASSVSSEVARDHDFQGPCTTVATGCTAGLDAIGTAAGLISARMADVVVTGGVDAPLSPIVFTAFDNIKALTRRNDAPRRASRPFDARRDGFLLAEGCAVLVLESEEHARRRGARVRARVLGHASLSNAFHMTALPADGEALAATLRRALARARVSPDEVDYVNAHGSSTPQNDRNETGAFQRVFGERAPRVPISSTKSVVGHSLGAASAIETVVCVQALEAGVIPPTANYEEPDPDCPLDYVPNEARPARLRVVECNASGFSGIHSALLLGHADPRRAS